MSHGARIRLDHALEAAKFLGERWGFDESCYLVGSVRRRRAEIGDLEFVAPAHAGGGRDELCERIQATMETDDLFNIFDGETFGRALNGLKPGFLSASLVVRPWKGLQIPVQIYRYTPINLGWKLIERTGPREFGIWFLAKWKIAHGIPIGDTGNASVDGHLVDSQRQVIPVRTETEAFDLAQIGFIEPAMRDRFMERQNARAGGDR